MTVVDDLIRERLRLSEIFPGLGVVLVVCDLNSAAINIASNISPTLLPSILVSAGDTVEVSDIVAKAAENDPNIN